MGEEYDYIRSVNKGIQAKTALNKISNEKGIVIGEFNENNTGWKVQFSLDNNTLIQLATSNDLLIIGNCDNNTFLERLVRDIYAEDLETRQWASEILCYFIESNGSELDFDLLTYSVNKMIERLSIEDNYDVEQKLSEGIFEFIWLEKLTKEKERNLIIQLAGINKDTLFCYLDDEEYLRNKEVKEFISRGRK